MNKRDLVKLIIAADVVKKLNKNDSQWLNEMEGGLRTLAATAPILEKVQKKQNRVKTAAIEISQSTEFPLVVQVASDYKSEV